jgi:flagellar hook-basal body complex protein FliE
MIGAISLLSGIASQLVRQDQAVSTPGEFAKHLNDIVRQAEADAIGGIDGSVPVYKAVESVMNAERSLSAAVAIRDKIVGAYLELSRMQI